MKLLRSTPLFMKGILIAGMLSGYQHESDMVPAPEAASSASDQNARTAVAAGTLVKDGATDLSYNGQNLLRKEFCANVYSEFIYAPQLITGTKYQYGTPSIETKYTLDASGRCLQTAAAKTYKYEYNASGQLTLCYNKNQPNERREFTYLTDANGWKKSLSVVAFYDAQGAKTKELKFSYGAPGSLIPDKAPLTPDVLPVGVSRYLPVFGSFNTNLVQTLIEDKFLPNGEKSSSTAFLHTYTLDYAGRAKNITVKKVNGTFVSSTDRKYFVPAFKF